MDTHFEVVPGCQFVFHRGHLKKSYWGQDINSYWGSHRGHSKKLAIVSYPHTKNFGKRVCSLPATPEKFQGPTGATPRNPAGAQPGPVEKMEEKHYTPILGLKKIPGHTAVKKIVTTAKKNQTWQQLKVRAVPQLNVNQVARFLARMSDLSA